MNWKISKELIAGIILLGLMILVYILLPIVNLNPILGIINSSVKNYASFVSLIQGMLFSSIKLLLFIVVLGLIIDKKLYTGFKESKGITKILQVLILIISGIYYLVGLYLSIKNFDLGYDEVWYLPIARGFADKLHLLIFNGKLSSFPYASMLLNNFVSLINYWTGWTNVRHFKAVNSLINLLCILMIFKIYKKDSGIRTGLFSTLILIFLPGFLFVSSSYFGVIISMTFVIVAGHVFFHYDSRLSVILSGLMMALAMHTKLQLIPLLILIILIQYIIERKKKILLLLMFVVASYLSIFGLRYLPNLFVSAGNPLRTFTRLGNSFTDPRNGFFFAEHIQLFNNFIPIIIFLTVSLLYLRKKRLGFDLFMYICSSVIMVWWMIFYNMATFRHLYLGLIPFSFISAKAISEFFSDIIQKTDKKAVLSTNLILLSIIFLILNSAYTNLKDAYIGYNDGVQFHYSGVKSRLFKPIVTDTSQKEFYRFASQVIGKDDIIYNGNPHYTNFYLGIRALSYKEIEIEDNHRQWLIISRENYPLGLAKAYTMMKALPGEKLLSYKNGDYELYRIYFKEEEIERK
ncbi:MAG: hypothetical protein K9J13_03735 [Saprospiraceae bacterium]|nr:hypothetical protein [Saprospiraceae bacterium]